MKAIVTSVLGSDYQRIAAVSVPTLQAYASRIGVDLVVLGQPYLPGCRVAWEKLAIGDMLDRYERVAWIDADAIVNPAAPDIFERVPYTALGAFDEGKIFVDRPDQLKLEAKFYGLGGVLDIERSFAYFNAGVVVASHSARPLFAHPPRTKVDSIMPDQTYLNLRLIALGLPLYDLTSKWNGLHSIHGPNHRKDLYIVHYAGYPKTVDWVDRMIEEMRRDLGSWK